MYLFIYTQVYYEPKQPQTIWSRACSTSPTRRLRLPSSRMEQSKRRQIKAHRWRQHG